MKIFNKNLSITKAIPSDASCHVHGYSVIHRFVFTGRFPQWRRVLSLYNGPIVDAPFGFRELSDTAFVSASMQCPSGILVLLAGQAVPDFEFLSPYYLNI